jgi:hypothetical protein
LNFGKHLQQKQQHLNNKPQFKKNIDNIPNTNNIAGTITVAIRYAALNDDVLDGKDCLAIDNTITI